MAGLSSSVASRGLALQTALVAPPRCRWTPVIPVSPHGHRQILISSTGTSPIRRTTRIRAADPGSGGNLVIPIPDLLSVLSWPWVFGAAIAAAVPLYRSFRTLEGINTPPELADRVSTGHFVNEIIILFLAWYAYTLIANFCVTDNVEKTAEAAIEVIDSVAEATEKIAEDVAEAFPENESLKKAASKIKAIADEIEEDADKAEAFIDKVDEIKKEVDSIVDPLIEKVTKNKS